MRKLLGLLVLTGLMTGVAPAEILITQPGGGGSSSGSDLVAQAAAAAAAQAAANAQATANNAISNRGVQLNGSYLTNGTILTITGGGGGGGISNVIVNGKTGVLSGSGSNPVSTVTLVAADVGSVSNTAAGVSAAGGVTGAVFAATGTQPSVTLGLLSIPTNGLGGGGGSANAVTNHGATIVGYTLTNGATIDFPVALFSNPVTTTYWITNTIIVSNSLDYAITGLAANNVKVRYLVMFSSSTNEASGSRRGDFSVFTRPDRLCDSVIYSDSNQLYWAATSASAQAAGATTGTVADASGVVLRQRYAVGNGTRWDFLTATNATATTIFWGCTNKYATTATADTKIASANYSTPIFYDDDSAQNSMWCRFAWATPYTGTVTTIVRYGR